MLNIENFVCPAFGALQKGGPTLEFFDVSKFNKSCLTLLGPKIRFPEM